MNNLKLILGSPGCGKTTRLLEIVENEMEAGVPPSQIAFVTFTKAAANEAKERAAKKFGLDPEKDLPWFRTIHSMAYALLGMTRDEVMGPKDWRLFSEVVGMELSGYYDTESIPAPGSGKEGDLMLRIVDYAGTTMKSLHEAWHELAEPVDWWLLKRFFDAFLRYKNDISKMDFTDMLLAYINGGESPPLKVGVVDEGQDLTRAQWQVVERAFTRAERVYIGGDDDQAIYRWAGADVEYFLGLSQEPEILPISYRLPPSIHKIGNSVARRISRRYTKLSGPTSSRSGIVEYHTRPDGPDLAGEGTWLLLARNGYLLEQFVTVVRDYGVNYATRGGNAINPKHVRIMRLWERWRTGKIDTATAEEIRILFKILGLRVPQLKELQVYNPRVDFATLPWEKPWFMALDGIPMDARDYYISCLSRGTRLDSVPRIRIETIHGVKGAEADHVIILPDISGKTMRGYLREPDSEHRVFYVGVTRARKSLHIVAPQSDTYYPL